LYIVFNHKLILRILMFSY